VRGDRRRARATMLGLFRRGVFLNPMGTKLYLSLAHDAAACDELARRLDAVLADPIDA
jgi:glutamate-1-semialdehyde 2,1-aminomutase